MDDDAVRKIDKILARRGTSGNSCIAILQDIQRELGYVPVEATERVAEKTEISATQIWGVATFYTQFRFEPPGRHRICVCLGTACHVRGASELMKHLEDTLEVKSGRTTRDGRFTLEEVRCLGACALAPVITIDGDYHPKVTPRSAKRILKRYP